MHTKHFGNKNRTIFVSELCAMSPERSKIQQFFIDEIGDKGMNAFDVASVAKGEARWVTETIPASDMYVAQSGFEDLLGL